MTRLPRLALSLALTIGATTSAYAQMATTDNRAVQNPSVTSADHVQNAHLSLGHNSFTRGEAKARMERAGYTQISRPMLNHDGLWLADAMWQGAAVHIALDYKGNVAIH